MPAALKWDASHADPKACASLSIFLTSLPFVMVALHTTKSMLNADKALALILHEAKPLQRERVRLRKAAGRTLAEDILAKENVSPFDNSSMDGFAVRSADLATATKRKPALLTIVGESSAGKPFARTLGTGETVRVMTGAMIPQGVDAVVPLEMVKELEPGRVAFQAPCAIGANIRRAGEDIRKGERVLTKGTLLTPAHVAVLASLGYARVRVTRKPKVNILATGDELVAPDETPGEGQIRNSSSYALAGYVEHAGGEATILGIVKDRKRKIRKAVASALACDLLLVSGGVSVGKYDLVKDVFARVGVELKFWRVNIKPGKPLAFGTYKNTLVFGLPGNPASTGVTFLTFVRPAILAMLGQPFVPPLRMTAILDQGLEKHDAKRYYIRGIVTSANGVLHVRTTGTQSSGVMSSMAKANCFIILRESDSSVRKGSRVEIEMMP